MPPILLASAILAVHVAIIGFNLFGLVAIPLGAWRNWDFVRIRWWRALHLLSWLAVAVQAVLGRDCFLTVWQDTLEGRGAGQPPLIMRWVNGVIFWPVPIEVFAAGYVVILVYVVALWRLVPPRKHCRIPREAVQ